MDIKQMKDDSGLCYRRLAKRCGLSASVVWRVVNGQTRKPSMQTVEKLSRGFGVDSNTLIAAIKAHSEG